MMNLRRRSEGVKEAPTVVSTSIVYNTPTVTYITKENYSVPSGTNSFNSLKVSGTKYTKTYYSDGSSKLSSGTSFSKTYTLLLYTSLHDDGVMYMKVVSPSLSDDITFQSSTGGNYISTGVTKDFTGTKTITSEYIKLTIKNTNDVSQTLTCYFKISIIKNVSGTWGISANDRKITVSSI